MNVKIWQATECADSGTTGFNNGGDVRKISFSDSLRSRGECLAKPGELTDAGRFFLTRAREIVCLAEVATEQVREQYGTVTRTLRIGFISPFLDDLVAPTVREFRQRHPKVKVSLHDLPPRAQLDRLRDHQLDAAILGNLSDEDRALYRVQRIGRGTMCLVLPAGHLLAVRKSLRLNQLADEDWVSLSEAYFPGRRAFLQSACNKAGFSARIAAEYDSLSLMLAAVSSGEGVAMMPEHASKVPHTDCVLVPFSGSSPTVDVYLVQPNAGSGAQAEVFAGLLAHRAASLG